MSLRVLKEEIYLVLQIKGGHGFGFATSPLVITANLAGNVHESFVTEPSPQPKFENEFVWIMDKTKMKSIWSDKVPVRVECFSVSQSRRSRIGYIILNAKDAQIIQNESKIKENQIRLLGLSRDVALLKPELIFSFYITDIPIQSPKLNAQFSPRLDGTQTRMTERPLKVTLGSGREHFSLCITAGAVTNLKELLPSQSEVEPDLLVFSYSLLGAEITSSASSNHSVQLAVTSSLACLKTYFIRQPTVRVRLYMGTLMIGETTINVESLLLSDELHLKRAKYQTKTMPCRCLVRPCQTVPESTPDDCDSSTTGPCIDFTVSFSCEAPVMKKKPEVSSAPTLTSVGAGGDADNSQQAIPLQVPMTVPLVTQSRRPVDGGGETYRTQQPVSSHTVSVTITSLQLDQSAPSCCWLRLSQPCAFVLPHQAVPVPDSWTPVQWHLTFSLPRRLLESTLATHPAVLQFGAGDLVLAVAYLVPAESFTTHNRNEQIVILQTEEERIGEAVVAWALADYSSQSSDSLAESLSPPTQSRTAPVLEVLSPRTREIKMHSFVEELEDWAEKQRIIIMDRLKEEEAARLAALQSKWEEDRGSQVREGQQLVDKLHIALNNLRQEEAKLQEKQHKLKIYEEELEHVQRNKLQEFKDLSRRMQDEFNHKLSLIAMDKKKLERQVEELREENMEMKRILKETETRANEDKKLVDSLSHDLKILKEKLSVEQDSKNFFKDHCRKAEQEIHRLNCLKQQELEAQLNSEKKSLEQLAFQQLVVERHDLRQDQRLLEEIKQQLLHRGQDTDINSNSNGDAAYADGLFMDERRIRCAT